MFPSWFIVYVGIAVASVSAPVTGRLDIGQYAFWFGLVTYVLLLVIVCRRVWGVGEIPAPALPTTVIFAAPASLLLTGYMVSFSEKDARMVYALLVCSVVFWAVGMVYLAKTCRGGFLPSHSAFTFPLVISGLAVKLSAGFYGSDVAGDIVRCSDSDSGSSCIVGTCALRDVSVCRRKVNIFLRGVIFYDT